MSPEQRKIMFDNITINFRWILPVMMTGYIIAWGINENWKNQRFDNLQNGQEKVWVKISSVEDKMDSLKDKEERDYEYVLQHYTPQGGGK
jgi:hypothetical protein